MSNSPWTRKLGQARKLGSERWNETSVVVGGVADAVPATASAEATVATAEMSLRMILLSHRWRCSPAEGEHGTRADQHQPKHRRGSDSGVLPVEAAFAHLDDHGWSLGRPGRPSAGGAAGRGDDDREDERARGD